MATLNPQVPLEARQTVLDQVVAGASFTAYEITLEVRRRLGPTVEVPHSVVNSIVQTMFSNGDMAGYNRAPDTSVKAATPPFRYSPQGVRAATSRNSPTTAPAPVFTGVNRAKLPINLRYWNPVAAVIRAYSAEARAFQDGVGEGDKSFKVWLPTAQEPKFRVRSYGAVPSKSEVEARYSLLPGSQSHLDSKAAFAYADEFRITTFQGGTAKTYRAALDMTLVGTVVKDGEVRSKQEEGVEIEVAVKPGDIQRFCDEAAIIFAYFRVPPRIQSGILGAFNKPKPLLKGTGWKLTSHGGAVAIIGDVAYPINTLFLPGNVTLNLELDFAPGEVELSGTGESLEYTSTTRQALQSAFARMESEAWPQLESRIGTASNIWQAKIRWTQLGASFGTYFQNSAQKIAWKGIALENNRFDVVNTNEITVRLTSVPATGSGLKTQRATYLVAQPDTVVFLNNLGTRTGSPTRIREYFSAHPNVQSAYVLTFISEAAKERFIADNHFETVPTQLLSALPKPAFASLRGSRTLNRVPFDASKHKVLPPRNSLLAAFPNLSDGGYADLERWVRDSRFDGKQWPDFKRLYKKAEARMWPIQKRTRWNKTEAELPANTPLPNESEALVLGMLMGHLDSAGANRGEDRQFPNGGPTAKTVAYMVRRAENLLRFLQRGQGLSEERGALLAPLVAGSMMRAYCGDVRRTLAFRLGLQDSALKDRADLVQRIWQDEGLATPVLGWAFEWLRAHSEPILATPQRVRRFILEDDAETALYLLPGVLESGARWPNDYSLVDLANELQNNSIFEVSRADVLRLFARSPLLKARDAWVWQTLRTTDVSDSDVVSFVTPFLQERIEKGDWEAGAELTPTFRTVFMDALVASKPQGMRVKQWQHMARRGFLELYYPALQQMQMLPLVAQLLWEERGIRDEWIRLGGEAKWVEAFSPVIRDHARQEDFDFAVRLPAAGREVFLQELVATHGDLPWGKLSTLDANIFALFAPGLANVPLSDTFWRFVGDASNSGDWIDAVGRARAVAAFSALPSSVVRAVLDSASSGLEPLVANWLHNNAKQLSGDDAVLMLGAISLNEEIRTPALSRLRETSLNLRAALRLMESGLPEAQALARPYFENEGDEWATRALSLVDSPRANTRLYGLDLLARFPNRWTADLLRSLAEHDDTRVQAFVAAQLENTLEVATSEAVTAFDRAIINSRGRSRQAKTGVQRRLNTQQVEEETEVETLLEAARNGAPRDRAWALQQLVRLQLSGTEVPELQLSGAVASASN